MKVYTKNNKIYIASDNPLLGLVSVEVPQDACLQLLYYIEEIYVDPDDRFETIQEVRDELESKLEKANDEIERLNEIVEDLKVYSGLDKQEKFYGPLE